MSIIKIQIHIQIQADSFVSDTNGFINFWLRSIVTREETQFLKAYANHTMLASLQCVAHPVMFKISIHLCRSRSEKLNRMPQRSKTQLSSKRSNTQLRSFQNLQILRTISTGHDVIHTPVSFPVWGSGGLLWQMVIVISFAHERKTAPNDYAPGLRDSNSSKPYQTEWWNIINEKWLI